MTEKTYTTEKMGIEAHSQLVKKERNQIMFGINAEKQNSYDWSGDSGIYDCFSCFCTFACYS